MRKTAQQQWDETPDLTTPTERRWIDEWASGPWRFGGPSRYKITERTGPEDGGFNWLIVRIRPYWAWKPNLGSMPITLDFIKAEVRKNRREAARERRAEAERQVGAFI